MRRRQIEQFAQHIVGWQGRTRERSVYERRQVHEIREQIALGVLRALQTGVFASRLRQIVSDRVNFVLVERFRQQAVVGGIGRLLVTLISKIS